MLRSILSVKEKEMFKVLGFSDNDIAYMETDLSVIKSYEWAVSKIFMENQTGPAVESLRRCFTAIMRFSINRHTEEFDDLIQL